MIVTVTKANGLEIGLQPAPPGLGFYDPGEYRVQIEQDSQYEVWRRWRYEHIGVEFEMETHRMARAMWEAKRPWWLQF